MTKNMKVKTKTYAELVDEKNKADFLLNEAMDDERFGKAQEMKAYIHGLEFAMSVLKSCEEWDE